MTVNHDVTGSSPVGGATKVRRAIYGPFSFLFESRGRLTSVVMPDTVTAMGKEVFSFTTMLIKVEFSKNLKSIHPISFAYGGIKSIELPDGVEELGLGAFYDHVNLKTIYVPASVKTIGYQVIGCFSNYGFEGRYGVTIYGEAGSNIESYAKANNINFVSGKPSVDPPTPTTPVDPLKSIAVYFKTPTNTTPTNTTPTNTTPTVCSHENTTTKVTKPGSYFTSGIKTTVCRACGKVVKSTAIPMKVLKTPFVTVKVGKKAINVTLKKKVKDAKSIVVTYKIGKTTKTKTFKNAKDTYTIKNLKKGTYKVTVKAIVKSGKKIASSKATKTKSVKVK